MSKTKKYEYLKIYKIEVFKILIILLLIAIILIPIIIAIIARIITGDDTLEPPLDKIWGISVGFGVLALVGLITAILAIICNLSVKQSDYEICQSERDVLVYCLERTHNDEYFYLQVNNFNNKLREIKYYANSKWTNWFCNNKIADEIDYINFEEYIVDY